MFLAHWYSMLCTVLTASGEHEVATLGALDDLEVVAALQVLLQLYPTPKGKAAASDLGEASCWARRYRTQCNVQWGPTLHLCQPAIWEVIDRCRNGSLIDIILGRPSGTSWPRPVGSSMLRNRAQSASTRESEDAEPLHPVPNERVALVRLHTLVRSLRWGQEHSMKILAHFKFINFCPLKKLYSSFATLLTSEPRSVNLDSHNTGCLHESLSQYHICTLDIRIQPSNVPEQQWSHGPGNYTQRALCTNDCVVPPFMEHHRILFAAQCKQRSTMLRPARGLHTCFSDVACEATAECPGNISENMDNV